MRDNAVLNQVLDGSGIGVPNVIESLAMPANLGAGTNQDALLTPALQDPILIGPIQFAADSDVLSGTGQLRLYAYAHVAMVGARLASIVRQSSPVPLPRRNVGPGLPMRRPGPWPWGGSACV